MLRVPFMVQKLPYLIRQVQRDAVNAKKRRRKNAAYCFQSQRADEEEAGARPTRRFAKLSRRRLTSFSVRDPLKRVHPRAGRVPYQNRSAAGAGVREMERDNGGEAEEEEVEEYSVTADKERGQVAQSMPH